MGDQEFKYNVKGVNVTCYVLRHTTHISIEGDREVIQFYSAVNVCLFLRLMFPALTILLVDPLC